MSGRMPEWPEAFGRWRWDGAELLGSETADDVQAGQDSLGTPGRIRTRRTTARARDVKTAAAVRDLLAGAGMSVVATEPERIELSEPPAAGEGSHLDPFALEHRVHATVRGRAFPGGQRAAVEAKVTSLRRELADPALPEKRRGDVSLMLRRLEEGLETTVELRSVDRRFAPSVPVTVARTQIGTALPLRVGSRIVYRVEPRPVPGAVASEEDVGALAFHVVALGAAEAAFVVAGEIHGFRHVVDLDGGRVHDAWFVNRERSRTEATAPWLGRAVFRELSAKGSATLILARRRDALPIGVEVVERSTRRVRCEGRDAEVPVLVCLTSRDDEMVVVDDAENPLARPARPGLSVRGS
jgi:hypothetical protein